MVDYGVTPEGYVRKPYEVILQEINDYQRANVSPTLDLSPESPQGQLNASIARQIAVVWEQSEVMFHALDPDAAEAFLLQNLAKLTGTGRRAASFSLVTAQVTADSGTLLEEDVHFANVQGDPENQWTPAADFTAPSTGTHDVVFRAVEAGPVQAPAGTLNVITTSVTGWDSINNTDDAALGLPADDDETLRTRRQADLARAGSGTRLAIQSDVNALDDVQAVIVFENKTDSVDANGLPPHSVEVVVDDGEVPAADDDLLAQTIFDSTGAGIQWHGTGSSGTATDEEGTDYTVPFTRVTFVEVHLAYTIETGAGYIGDAELQSHIVAQAQSLFNEVGDDVLFAALLGIPLSREGVLNVTDFFLDITDTPVATDDIPIGPRSKAAFSTANVDITT
jgi:uncharacterized phage protein gp47/JayE